MKIFSTPREFWFLLAHPALWRRKPLSSQEMDPDPFAQFTQWYRLAQKSWLGEFPNAMCLSTISRDGWPEGRIVLLKDYSSEGFVFYSNADSRKGEALAQCQRASITFYWERLQRQVRVQGDVAFVAEEESDCYFKTRPRTSQLGAWASKQSRELKNREELLSNLSEAEKRFAGKEVTRPPYWRGYKITPRRFEFWELRLNRLHDRFEYQRDDSGLWLLKRLSP